MTGESSFVLDLILDYITSAAAFVTLASVQG